MNILQLPWLDYSLLITLVGSLLVSRQREPIRAFTWGLALTGAALACATLAWLGYYLRVPPEAGLGVSPQLRLLGRQVFALDELNAPLVPAIALIHFLTALSTARVKMRRFSFTWSLAAETMQLALFSCKEPWLLIGLMAATTVPPYIELASRGRPTRVYVLHMAVFLALLVLGWTAVEVRGRGAAPGAWATVPLLLAILVRCGTIPAHCWVTDWFEHATFGIAILLVAPLGGVYTAVRLVLPIAPEWILHGLAYASLINAVYAAGMGVIQNEVRRCYAFLFLSHASLVLVGLELDTVMSLTGSLCLWFSVILSLAGFGLTLRALEFRFGRLSLRSFHGLYEHSPTLAVCFLLTGLASVGFPGTLGFISTELLIDSAVEANPTVGIAIVAAAALNGIAVVRAYLHLFTGGRHASTVWLGIGTRERVALLTLAAMILGGGLFPQPGVTTRELAAEEILEERARHLGGRAVESGAAPRADGTRPAPSPTSSPARSPSARAPLPGPMSPRPAHSLFRTPRRGGRAAGHLALDLRAGHRSGGPISARSQGPRMPLQLP
jgi:NADH-quinone oxidoreductase subunit M